MASLFGIPPAEDWVRSRENAKTIFSAQSANRRMVTGNDTALLESGIFALPPEDHWRLAEWFDDHPVQIHSSSRFAAFSPHWLGSRATAADDLPRSRRPEASLTFSFRIPHCTEPPDCVGQAVTMRLKMGSATVSVAAIGVPPMASAAGNVNQMVRLYPVIGWSAGRRYLFSGAWPSWPLWVE